MKRTWQTALILTAMTVVAGTAMSSVSAGAAPNRSTSTAAKRAPVVGHLLLRKYRVTFKVGDRFTVHTRDGKQLATDVTLAQLKSLDAGLYEALAPIVAGDAFVYAGRWSRE